MRQVHLPCGYTPEPGQKRCGLSAVTHVAVGQRVEVLDTELFVGLLACETHVADARRAGRNLGEHPIVLACDSPAAVWLANSSTCSLEKPAPLGVRRHPARNWHPALPQEQGRA